MRGHIAHVQLIILPHCIYSYGHHKIRIAVRLVILLPADIWIEINRTFRLWLAMGLMAEWLSANVVCYR